MGAIVDVEQAMLEPRCDGLRSCIWRASDCGRDQCSVLRKAESVRAPEQPDGSNADADTFKATVRLDLQELQVVVEVGVEQEGGPIVLDSGAPGGDSFIGSCHLC